ncbi:serum paraoxonase/arylesterase 1-like isoform X4 [Mytilus californianus]|uniref:serum paraoxonase/arylesterase 1-like isoform X4 n=1 Tax=Mytilus californianus TaxID=6549 RepID=UPI002246EE58|nr:serum paraoxonase/arylesterase 1-like isoform X4 [Mytilus californianus]
MIKKAIAVVVGIIIIQFIVKTLHSMEFLKYVYNHTPGPCRIVPGQGIGYEDMETLPNGLTLITSGLVIPTTSPTVCEYRKKHNGKGRIYLFDFNKPEKGIEELTIVGDQFNQSDFGPHGISLYKWKDQDKVTVMVVNHGSTGDTIEKFLFIAKDKQLKHVHTYRDPSIHFVNDVAMDSENSFYFTNFAYYKNGLLFLLEYIIPLAYGNLIYYDGKAYHKQYDGFVTINGLMLSHDQKYLYTGETIPQRFHTFTRQKNGTLSRYQEFNAKTALDNPTLDKDGNVLVGSHPILWQLMAHLDNPETPASSQVIKLHMKDGVVTKMTEVFSDNGHTLYGSSVASLYKDAMLVGTVYHKLMYCEVRYID